MQIPNSTAAAIINQRKLVPACSDRFRHARGAANANHTSGMLVRTPKGVSSPPCPGGGCGHCKGIGFRGRSAIFEVMEMNRTLQEMAFSRKTTRALRRQARLSGMTTLQEDGVRKVLAGVTTPEEILISTQREEAVGE